MNKKVLVAGLVVAGLVAGGVYFGPGDGGQGFIFKPKNVPSDQISVDRLNYDGQVVENLMGVNRDDLVVERDPVPTKKPNVNLGGKSPDFSINRDAMYEGDGSKRTPSNTWPTPSNNGNTGKTPAPVLDGRVRGNGNSAPAPAEEVDPLVAQQLVVAEKISAFQTLVWQYESTVRTFSVSNCLAPSTVIGAQNAMRDLSDDTLNMVNRIGYLRNGNVDFLSRLGQNINDAKDHLENFARAIDHVNANCINKAGSFPQAYFDDVNYGFALGEVKDNYEVMSNLY